MQEITSNAVPSEVGLDEGTKAGADVGPSHLKEAVEHCDVVDAQKDVGVHLLHFQHVIDVGACIVLAGVALATLYYRSLLCLVLFFVQVKSPLRELIELARES